MASLTIQGTLVLLLTLQCSNGFAPPRRQPTTFFPRLPSSKREEVDVLGSGLPIDAVMPQILAALRSSATLVLQAPPGAGKTTCVPLAILADNTPPSTTPQHEREERGDGCWLGTEQKIVMLEPRRLAARGACNRMASTLNERAGQTVGYVVRQESRISQSTRIECVTEGVLLRRLQRDPFLEDTGCVILDEFHERSLDADLALALLLDLHRSGLRPDLRIVVMSATVGDDLCRRLVGRDPSSEPPSPSAPSDPSSVPSPVPPSPSSSSTTPVGAADTANAKAAPFSAESNADDVDKGIQESEVWTSSTDVDDYLDYLADLDGDDDLDEDDDDVSDDFCLMPGGSLVASEGRGFPVDVRYFGRPKNVPLRAHQALKRWELEEWVADACVKALQLQPSARPQEEGGASADDKSADDTSAEGVNGVNKDEVGGDVLAFLPGEAEIKGVLRLLEDRLATQSPDSSFNHVELLPLYGSLPQDQQLRAVSACTGQIKTRKVVVASPIAEASLTLPGVRVV
eukprot:CAMPEP_0171991556 /NCGR_PEP_ID=MMETSP0993-20121228/277491_1 /TAXON_ID=483369 /ORGANISM="non described non described, Strain CCMP2098" /LENGTH=514 /DNA_ID=CAMNT_0012644583 /DNA_START=168 /DNA_END=1708 /DNA_ORIENTATION=+